MGCASFQRMGHGTGGREHGREEARILARMLWSSPSAFAPRTCACVHKSMPPAWHPTWLAFKASVIFCSIRAAAYVYFALNNNRVTVVTEKVLFP